MKVIIDGYREDIGQEVDIVIDNYDTWNMDVTLARIIVPMLEQLKATTHGAPIVDDMDVPEYLRSTNAPPKENEWDTDDNWFKRWDWVLDEMIWSFKQKLIDINELYETGVMDMKWNPDTGLLEEGPNHTYKLDMEGLEKHHDRMKRGFMLFGKYYEGLWD